MSVIISLLSFQITHKFEINVLVLAALLTFVGNKPKQTALIMVSRYVVINVFENSFWMQPLWEVTHDILRQKFFRNMTVIGGLLLVLAQIMNECINIVATSIVTYILMIFFTTNSIMLDSKNFVRYFQIFQNNLYLTGGKERDLVLIAKPIKKYKNFIYKLHLILSDYG